MDVSIVGATGYTGIELIKILTTIHRKTKNNGIPSSQ